MFINPSDWSIKFYWRTLIRDARDDRTRSASTGYARNTSSRSDFRRANISTWLRARALHVRGACSTSDSSPKYSPSPNINVPFRWGQPEISTKPPLMKYISFPISPPRKIGSWAWCWCSCAFMQSARINERGQSANIGTRCIALPMISSESSPRMQAGRWSKSPSFEKPLLRCHMYW